MSECLFCAIAAGAIPARVIAETENAIAFMDIAPAAPGHALVIPRTHHDDALGASPEALAACMELAASVGRAAEAALDATGVSFFSFARADGWQTVFHLHIHVVPRSADDGLVVPWPSAPADPDEIAQIAERLAALL